MSDDLESFLRKTDAMFAKVETQTRAIAQRWMMKCSAKLVLMTMGPENQWPTTEYIALGRLRAGYTWGLSAPAVTPINRLRAETDWTGDGAPTRAKLDAELRALGLHAEMFLYNVVGYGWYPHYGEGRGHKDFGPRPYVLDFASAPYAQAFVAEAAAEVLAETV